MPKAAEPDFWTTPATKEPPRPRPDPAATDHARSSDAQPRGPRCPLCGMGLVPGKGAPTAGTVTVGVIGMLIGLALCLTVYGAVIGVPLLIYAAIRGSAKQRGLRCTACRHFIPAA